MPRWFVVLVATAAVVLLFRVSAPEANSVLVPRSLESATAAATPLALPVARTLISTPSAAPADLIAFIHSPEFGHWLDRDGSALAKLFARFSAPYPADRHGHGSPLTRELQARLAILRALGELKSPGTRGLYLTIMKNADEHWLVKRQALVAFRKNHEAFDSERERDEVMAVLDPRVISTAELSDETLLERLTHAN